MQTLTLADIYAKQGYLDEAIEICRAILAKEPDNTEAKRRLQEWMPRFECSTDEEMRALFAALSDDLQIQKLERWLVQPWS